MCHDTNQPSPQLQTSSSATTSTVALSNSHLKQLMRTNTTVTLGRTADGPSREHAAAALPPRFYSRFSLGRPPRCSSLAYVAKQLQRTVPSCNHVGEDVLLSYDVRCIFASRLVVACGAAPSLRVSALLQSSSDPTHSGRHDSAGSSVSEPKSQGVGLPSVPD